MPFPPYSCTYQKLKNYLPLLSNALSPSLLAYPIPLHHQHPVSSQISHMFSLINCIIFYIYLLFLDIFYIIILFHKGFPGGSVDKESACSAGELDFFSGSERSPGERNCNPLQYSCLGNPMDRGACWTTVHGVARDGHDLATKPPPPPSFIPFLLLLP